MNIASDKIDTVKNFIEFQLDFLNISYETFFEEDEALGGYCYLICSDHAAVIFSDHTPDGSLKMYQMNDKLLNWALDEGMTEEQTSHLDTYIKINRVCDMLDCLSNQKFSNQ
jgi:hypothetical protein